MPIYQSSVLKKFLSTQNETDIQQAFEKYSAYFLDPAIQHNIRNSKEEQFQEGFLRELFVNILGYTINPNPNFNLTTELKNIKDAKKTDGAILLPSFAGEGPGVRSALAVIELKGTDTKDLNKVTDQAFNYKNNQPDCVYVITSNFEKLRFYIHNAVEHVEFNLFTLTRDAFDLLWLFLQKDNLLGGIPQRVKEESLLEEEKVTKRLYKDYSAFKNDLWHDLCQNNPKADPLLLYKKSQKLLDRFLFIFFAEDKGLLPPNSISEIVHHWRKLKDLDEYRPLYSIYKKYFGYMNNGRKQPNKAEIHAYNGGLFKEDAVLDTLEISDAVLEQHCLKLTEYDFETEVDTNILGHIFEHSLNDIENVRAQLAGEEVDKSKTKRKKDGVFYTPKYITKYIVDNTVGILCQEKKTELGITEEEFAKDRKGRKTATLKKLDAQLKAYREWLLQLTICDPACGSGAFLNQALEFLMAEHHYVDELESQLLGYAMVFPDVENHILERNIYGVDINEESVEIARLSLWLRTAKKGRKLNNLSSNIKVGNSLIDDPAVAGDLAFNWQEEFPSIFPPLKGAKGDVKGGFDVVIGNPPYVLCQPSNTEERVLEKYKEFAVASYKIDLFHLFFEVSTRILRNSGRIGFITPNTYLTNKYIKPLREFLLSSLRLDAIVIHSEAVFPDASVDVATLVGTKSMCNEQVEILTSINSNIVHLTWAKTAKWYEDPDFVFNVKDVFEFDTSNCVKLGDICKTYFGIQAYDRKSSIARTKLSDDYLPIIDGGDIHAFTIAKPTKYFNYVDDDIKSGGSWDVYSLERVVVRQIGQIPIVGISKEKILASNTLYSVYPKDDVKIDLYFILGLLNSSLIKKFWVSNYSDSKLLFPKIKGYQLKSIPIIDCSLVEQLPLSGLSKNRVFNTEKRLEIVHAVTAFVVSKHSSLADSNPVKNWPALDFKGFLAELKKKKVKLSLEEEAEWMQYFNKKKAEANALQADIEKIDKEIDRMVYELYGLTVEEIKIVEGV